MSASVHRQANSDGCGITKTGGAANGTLQGQLMQQPPGLFGQDGQIGHVGRILFFATAFVLLLFVWNAFEHRPQHFLRVGAVWESREELEQAEFAATIPDEITLAGPLRTRMIPRQVLANTDSIRLHISYLVAMLSQNPGLVKGNRIHAPRPLDLDVFMHPDAGPPVVSLSIKRAEESDGNGANSCGESGSAFATRRRNYPRQDSNLRPSV
jgi:hypothetical protein